MNVVAPVKQEPAAAPKAPSPAVKEREGETFRSSMERAEQKQDAAAAEKKPVTGMDGQEAPKPEAKDEPLNGQPVAGTQLEQNGEAVITPAEPVLPMLPLMPPVLEGVKDTDEIEESPIPVPGEGETMEDPSLNPALMAALAALTIQAPIHPAGTPEKAAEPALGHEAPAGIQSRAVETALGQAEQLQEGAAPILQEDAAILTHELAKNIPHAAALPTDGDEEARLPGKQNTDIPAAPRQTPRNAAEAAAHLVMQPQNEAQLDLSVPGAAAEAIRPEAPALLTDMLLEQVQTAVSTGKEELFVQLKPESLGGLVIHLSMTEEGIKAQVRTGSENIQSLVNSQIAQLEDALRARNIPVVQMDVIYENPMGGSLFRQDQGAYQGERGSQRRPGGLAGIEESAGLYESMATAMPDMALPGEGREFSA